MTAGVICIPVNSALHQCSGLFNVALVSVIVFEGNSWL